MSMIRRCEHVQAHPRKALAVRVVAPVGEVQLCAACAAEWLGTTEEQLQVRIRSFDNHPETLKRKARLGVKMSTRRKRSAL